MKRNKKYNPTSIYNPAQQVRKLNQLKEKLEIHRRDIQAISKSHDNHISYLGNFARHDIKNAIQSMDSVFSTTKPREFDDSTINSLSTYLDVIRNTIDNFAKLVPYSTSGKFTLDTLLIAVELLARGDMQKNEIEMKFEYPKNSEILIELPFQVILQMINNVIINAIKALESIEIKKMLITASIDHDVFKIEIKDNGCTILEDDLSKVFDYGYSTTGGSGIGLYHAKYLCEQYFEGSIKVKVNTPGIYNKTFFITLPICLQNGKDNNNN